MKLRFNRAVIVVKKKIAFSEDMTVKASNCIVGSDFKDDYSEKSLVFGDELEIDDRTKHS